MLDQKEKTGLLIEAVVAELLCRACRRKVDLIDYINDIGRGNGLLRDLRETTRQIEACRVLLGKCARGEDFDADDVTFAQVAAYVQRNEVDDTEEPFGG